MAFNCQYQDYPQVSPGGQADVPPQEPTSEATVEPKSNKKLIFIAVGLVLLVVICFVFFFYTGANVQSNEDEILKNYSGEWLENTTETAEKNVQSAMDAAIKARQMVQITTVYQCSSDICFELKSSASNTAAILMNDTDYYINGASKTIISWDGGLSGDSCDNLTSISPNQRCFGKVNNVKCLNGDVLKVVMVWGQSSEKKISMCS